MNVNRDKRLNIYELSHFGNRGSGDTKVNGGMDVIDLSVLLSNDGR